MSGTKLVMGASGFLGSHVTRQLVERGDQVRVWIRESSSTVAFDDLEVERHYGDLRRRRRAARGDEGCRHGLLLHRRRARLAPRPGAALRHQRRGPAPRAGRGRRGRRAEVRLLQHASARSPPPSPAWRTRRCRTTGDTWAAPTSSPGSRPRSWSCGTTASRGCRPSCSTSGRRTGRATTARPRTASWSGPPLWAGCPRTRRAARWRWSASRTRPRAFLLAEEHGRPGERYIVSEGFLPYKDLFDIAADEGGVAPPKFGIPHAGDAGHRSRRRGSLADAAQGLGGHPDQRPLDAHPVRARPQQGHPRARLATGPDRGLDPRCSRGGTWTSERCASDVAPVRPWSGSG